MRADERFVKTLKGEKTDRMPVIENSMWWYQTLNRWEKEGMPFSNYQGSMQEIAAIQEYFGLDVLVHWWIRPYTAASPEPLTFGGGRGVVDEESYEKILRPTLFPELKMDKEFIEWIKKRKSKGDIILEFIMNGPFWEPREYMGIENHLYSFYDQPDLYKRMVSEMLEWQKKVVEYAMNTLPFDYVTVAEDMSYNNGPMLSKAHFEEFMAPYYREMVPFVNSFGLPLLVDSDGDIKEPIQWFNEVGVAGYHPLEAQAGCDVNELAEIYPYTAFIGNFNKMIMHKGEAALREEFERLKPCIDRGRYVVSVDHQTPPSVSIDDYRLYVRLLKEYAKR